VIARLTLTVSLAWATGCARDLDRARDRGGGTGGGGNQPGNGRDAGDDGASGSAISGTLCRLTDLRFFEVCARTDLSGIDVGIRGSAATALTDSDGAFSIDAPASGPIVLEVGFATPDIKNVVYEVAAGSLVATVPVVLQADYAELLDALLVFEPDGTGSMAVYARDGASAVTDVEVIGPPGSQAPFYDAGSALEWSQLGLTGVGGAALIFAVGDEDRAALSMIDSENASVDLDPPIEDGALTFAVGRF
jgi:hypothetical protein